MSLTFWKKADLFPPVRVRLLARRCPGGPPLTGTEIAQRTGLSQMTVAAISQQTDWRGIDLPTMRLFLGACGLDFENAVALKRANNYLRGKIKKGVRVLPRLTYLQNSPSWESEFRPLAEIFFNADRRI